MWQQFAAAYLSKGGAGGSSSSPASPQSRIGDAGGLNSGFGDWTINMGSGSTAPGPLMGASPDTAQLVALVVAGGLVLILAARWAKKA